MKFINKYTFKKPSYRLIFYIALSLIISYIILDASQSEITWKKFWNYFPTFTAKNDYDENYKFFIENRSSSYVDWKFVNMS